MNTLALPLLLVAVFSLVFSGVINVNAQSFKDNIRNEIEQLNNECYAIEYLNPDGLASCVRDKQDKLDKLHELLRINEHEGEAITPEPVDDKDGEKKYCEGKGEWNGNKCVIDNEEEQAAYEDAVCDNPDSGSKICGGGSNGKDNDADNNNGNNLVAVEEDDSNNNNDNNNNDDSRKISFRDNDGGSSNNNDDSNDSKDSDDGGGDDNDDSGGGDDDGGDSDDGDDSGGDDGGDGNDDGN